MLKTSLISSKPEHSMWNGIQQRTLDAVYTGGPIYFGANQKFPESGTGTTLVLANHYNTAILSLTTMISQCRLHDIAGYLNKTEVLGG